MVESTRKIEDLDLSEELALRLGIISEFKIREGEDISEFERRKRTGRYFNTNLYDFHSFAIGELLEAARTAVGNDCEKRLNGTTFYALGDERYYCWGSPEEYDNISKEDWDEFFRICCEAGFIMQIPESEKGRDARIVLSLIDSIMFEAILRNNEKGMESYLNVSDYPDSPNCTFEEFEEDYGDWAKGIDDNSEILIGGFYRAHSLGYELLSKYQEKTPIYYSRTASEMIGLFRSLGLDSLDEFEGYISNPERLLDYSEYQKADNLLWKSDKNERLLTRTSTLRRTNEIYKAKYLNNGLGPIL